MNPTTRQITGTDPTTIRRDEPLKFGLLDTREPDAYLQGQIQKQGC
ncbi:hypothetical protein [Laspinema olomoucense]|uniref:Uncharacterized protein n=1 Tax=Laspinema olomoucense D3b TaxID=2953688 RepID=A0ABT2NBC0_9CYAN|nr:MULTISPECIES: hypothetical protein [unclassified Laspinema]MCT7979786.1 hypothetical protein [Laspinema sp. D3b]MCT7990635.1 hypothetical protein [Laspinema sp. D3a]